jgi:hypothetical protein
LHFPPHRTVSPGLLQVTTSFWSTSLILVVTHLASGEGRSVGPEDIKTQGFCSLSAKRFDCETFVQLDPHHGTSAQTGECRGPFPNTPWLHHHRSPVLKLYFCSVPVCAPVELTNVFLMCSKPCWEAGIPPSLPHCLTPNVTDLTFSISQFHLVSALLFIVAFPHLSRTPI